MGFTDVLVPSTDVHYWLRWEVAVCFVSVAACFGTSVYLLWRYEGPHADHQAEPAAGPERHARRPGVVYSDEAWRPCLRDLHPGWLLAYRFTAFVFFIIHTTIIISCDRTIVYYYTDSVRCCQSTDGSSLPLQYRETSSTEPGTPRQIAGFWTYLLQIIYQTSAGAVMLTDCVFWFIIFPYIWIHHHTLHYKQIVMHSVNAVFLLGEAILHSLPFPWFRIGYFFLWTAAYVVFQWSFHALHNTEWPYPFLDLSSKLAPLWYFAAGVMQVPCFFAFQLLTQLLHRMIKKKGSQVVELSAIQTGSSSDQRTATEPN